MKFHRPGHRRGSLQRLRRARAAAKRIKATRAAATRESPGALLRRARVDQRKTLAEVAEALRLPQATVAAIEREDYAGLPEAAYVLGYWRNYAFLLGLDIEASIKVHKENLSEGAGIERELRRVSAGALARRAVSWGFAMLSVLLLLGFWFEQRPQSYVHLEPEESREAQPVAADSPDATPFSQPEPVFNEKEERAWQEVHSGQAAQSNQTAAAQNARAANGENAAASALAASPNELILSVGQDSWIEVRDATNVQLVQRLVGRGRRLLLKGVPPFSVYVGNAEGVAVEYQGRPVQFAPNAGGLFARFNVGGR